MVSWKLAIKKTQFGHDSSPPAQGKYEPRDSVAVASVTCAPSCHMEMSPVARGSCPVLMRALGRGMAALAPARGCLGLFGCMNVTLKGVSWTLMGH